ncbi:MAG TPA: hypothetical protein VLC55_12750 [Burkholderiales bacterium]|nr:hypothetical protein [Burkholderiales bacterium]
MKYYVLTIYGGTDPALSDSFEEESERDEDAVLLLRETDPDEDAVFCIDVDDEGELDIYRFAPRDVKDEEEEETEEDRYED